MGLPKFRKPGSWISGKGRARLWLRGKLRVQGSQPGHRLPSLGGRDQQRSGHGRILPHPGPILGLILERLGNDSLWKGGRELEAESVRRIMMDDLERPRRTEAGQAVN